MWLTLNHDPMGGVVAGMLVPGIPASAEEQAAIRAKVLSREHIRGSGFR